MRNPPESQVSMKNTQFFLTAEDGRGARDARTAKKYAVPELEITQPFPADRVTVFDPSRQLYPLGKRLWAIDGPLKGQLVRVLYVRAQIEDCEDYTSYVVGVGDILRHPEMVPENCLGPL